LAAANKLFLVVFVLYAFTVAVGNFCSDTNTSSSFRNPEDSFSSLNSLFSSSVRLVTSKPTPFL
jgi:hypothetical protein